MEYLKRDGANNHRKESSYLKRWNGHFDSLLEIHSQCANSKLKTAQSCIIDFYNSHRIAAVCCSMSVINLGMSMTK